MRPVAGGHCMRWLDVRHHAPPGAKLSLVTCIALWLAGCAATAPQPSSPPVDPVVLAEPGRFGARPDIPDANDLHALLPEQREAFLRYLEARENAGVPLNRRVYNYLEQITRDFNYQGDTLRAADALSLGRGNCLSLAIVTTALAQLAGVEIGYQLVDDIPVFQVEGNLVTRGVHLRSILYEKAPTPQPGVLQLSRRGLVVDYFPTGGSRNLGNVQANGYLAMYYRNVAAEALGRDDYRTAYWYLLQSLELAPANAAALNMLAVLYGRAGDEARAEAVYRRALQVADDSLSLLKNYRALLLRAGRDAEAREIEERLKRLDDPSPMRWLGLARAAYDNGEYDLAIGYYRRAIELAPYLHEGHLGLAWAYYADGRLESARRALEHAVDNAFRKSTRSLYQAKLQALTEELHRQGSGG